MAAITSAEVGWRSAGTTILPTRRPSIHSSTAPSGKMPRRIIEWYCSTVIGTKGGASPTAICSSKVTTIPVYVLMPCSSALRLFPCTSRQCCLPHQVAITFPRRSAPLVDRPHHQTLPPSHIPRRKNAGHAGRKLAVLCLGVRAWIFLDAELIDQLVLRSAEAQRQQDQLSRKHPLRTRNTLRHRSAIVLDPFHLNGVDRLDMSVVVAYELGRLDGVLPWVLSPKGFGFLLAIIEAIHLGPLRPGIVRSAARWRHRDNFQLPKALAAMTQRSAYAVRSRVAAADHDHILVLGRDVLSIRVLGVQQALRIGVQKLHGKMNALEVAAFSLGKEVVGPGGTAAQYHSIEFLAELLGRIIFADLAVRDKGDPFGRHQIDAALDHTLVELHVGYAVHEQAADSIGTLKNGDLVPGPIELGSAGQAGRSRADNRDLFAGALSGRLRNDPALVKCLIDDGTFDALDRDGRLDDAQHTRALTGSRAYPAGELGKVVGLVQPFEGFFPQTAVNQVVPLGDQVVDRTAARHPFNQGAGVAERHAAIHAAGALSAQLFFFTVFVKLQPIPNALGRRPGQRQLTPKFQEAGGLTHSAPLCLDSSSSLISNQKPASSPLGKISWATRSLQAATALWIVASGSGSRAMNSRKVREPSSNIGSFL